MLLDPVEAESLHAHGSERAAVLVPLYGWPARPGLIFTERRRDLSRHAGEISFPGGRADPGETLVECAIREAEEEIGLDPARHRPQTFEEIEEWEGLNFDLIVTLSPEAHHAALELTRALAVDVEYWPTVDPTATQGSREQKIEAYREMRDRLKARIEERFGRNPAAETR